MAYALAFAEVTAWLHRRHAPELDGRSSHAKASKHLLLPACRFPWTLTQGSQLRFELLKVRTDMIVEAACAGTAAIGDPLC